MITQELKQQILSLSPDEQHEIVRLIQAQTNSSTGINKTPGVVGGDACIRNMRIPVWSLVQYRNMGANDDRILEAYPQLTATDLANPWTYAAAFPDEAECIDMALRNEESIEGKLIRINRPAK